MWENAIFKKFRFSDRRRGDAARLPHAWQGPQGKINPGMRGKHFSVRGQF